MNDLMLSDIEETTWFKKNDSPLKKSYVKTLYRPIFQALNTTGLPK